MIACCGCTHGDIGTCKFQSMAFPTIDYLAADLRRAKAPAEFVFEFY